MNSYHIGQKIKEFLERQEGGVTQAAEKLDYTYSALFPIFRKEDVHTKLIRKISEVYGVPMSYFLQEESSVSDNLNNGTFSEYRNNKIAVLEAEKRGLEKEIQLLREMVEILKKDK